MKILAATLLASLALVTYCGKNTGNQSTDGSHLKATISYLSGQVELERSGQKQKAEVGTVLKPSDIILTGTQAAVDVAIAGVGIVKMGADSRAEVISLTGTSRTS